MADSECERRECKRCPGVRAEQASKAATDGDNAMLVALGCLTAMCGAFLVVFATISAVVWLARWGLGW